MVGLVEGERRRLAALLRRIADGQTQREAADLAWGLEQFRKA